jgi:ligand-binding SRPBCC domain-containing protein
MRVELEYFIAAPVERCFDLSRSIDLHTLSAAATRERAVDGLTTGLIGPGQEVTWRARHLGIRWTLTSRITAFDRPSHFRDSQLRGPFRRFDHDHFFQPEAGGTRVREVFDFQAPGGPLGRLAERAFLAGHMRRFLIERSEVIRRVAETDEWAEYVAGA